MKEFSFHIKDELKPFEEIKEIDNIIAKTIEDYKMTKKFSQMEESKIYKASIKELKFAREHLRRVMNMDFDRPT